MALVGRPSWQTDDLLEEWPSSPSSSGGGGTPASTGPLDQQHPPSPSPAAPGTFVHKDDASAAAGHLQGPLAKLRQGQAAASTSLFSPLKLESMFQPPSPPAAVNDIASTSPSTTPAPAAAHAPVSLPEVILTPPQPSLSTTPSRPPSAPSPSPSPSFSPSPAPRGPPPTQLASTGQRQLYHAPPVPSRLANTFTPADLTASTIDLGPEEEVGGGGNSRERDEADEDEGFVLRSRGAAGELRRSQGTRGSWPATTRFEFECRPLAAVAARSMRSDDIGSGNCEGDDRSLGGATTTHTRLSLHTSHAQDHGPARTATAGLSPSTVSSTSPAAAAQAGEGEGRKLSLFQPTYDTFTRDFMSAIVDTIESSPSSSSSTSAVAAAGAGADASSEERAVDFRDPKRIRLTSASSGASHAPRVAPLSPAQARTHRSKASSSSSGTTAAAAAPSRDWDGEARELMRRVKQLGQGPSSPRAAAAAAGRAWGRVVSGSSAEGQGWGQGVGFSSFESGGEEGGEGKGRRIEAIAELPETDASPPQPPYDAPYRLPSTTAAAAAAVPRPPSPTPQRARPSAYVRESSGVFDRLHALSAASSSAESTGGRSAAGGEARGEEGEEKENALPGEGRSGAEGRRQSPRKLLRSLSVAVEQGKEERERDDGPTTSKSPLRTSLSTRPPPPAPSSGAAGAYPSGTATSDLNRYVSSSTTVPASTIGQSTVSTSASFTKHAGKPPPAPAAPGATRATTSSSKLTTIPLDERTPLRVGKLEFDRARARWVRNGGAGGGSHSREGSSGSAAVSDEDDPFKDFNSTVGSGRPGAGTDGSKAVGGNLIEQLRASSTTPPSDEPRPPPPPTQEQGQDGAHRSSLTRAFERSLSVSSHTADGAGEHGDGFSMDEVAASLKSFQFPSSSSQESLASLASPPRVRPPPLKHHNSAPVPAVAATPVPAAPASASRSRVASTGGLRPCLTPVSVLKKRSPGVGFRSDTPANGSADLHRRSVSFSDGKKAGKIELQVERIEFSLVAGGGRKGKGRADEAREEQVRAQGRAARMQSMLDGLGEDEVSESMASLAEQTPSKGGSSLRHFKPRDPPVTLATRSRDVSTVPEDETNSSLVFADLTTRSTVGAGRSFHYGGGRGAPGDATFLTECSFGGVRDRLVELITDAHPFVAYWEDLMELNLEGRAAGSVARLKEFMPRLIEANLNRNDLSYLSGLPGSVEVLHAAHNRLSELTAVAHLARLRFLDISFNQLAAVNQLDCLKNLTELKLDANLITDLAPLFGLEKLLSLSAEGNVLSSVDFSSARWLSLETLDLSRNKLAEVEGLDRLTSLTTLTLDDNRLRQLSPSAPLLKLKTLKISGNALREVDVRSFPALRTLYADRNELETINPSGGRTKLQTLSLRSQGDAVLTLSARDLRDIKRLFLSGSRLSPTLFDHPCPNLTYLELASCKLTHLPADLATFAPALRTLNLNYNFLPELAGVEGLRKLGKLSVVGSRLKEGKSVLKVLRSLPALEMLDLRMNPFTLAMYLPLMVNAPLLSSTDLTTSSASSTTASVPQPAAPLDKTGPWAELDAAFRRALPDEWYVRRLAHRGAVMRLCPGVEVLDGVRVEDGERRKAEELLTALEEGNTPP